MDSVEGFGKIKFIVLKAILENQRRLNQSAWSGFFVWAVLWRSPFPERQGEWLPDPRPASWPWGGLCKRSASPPECRDLFQ